MTDGDGWVLCELGHRHWGRYGAAGLLVWHRAPGGELELLLQHRASWSHHGDTWGLPGGARASFETPEAAALREAFEEAGIDASALRITGILCDEHGGWSYHTVVARAERRFSVSAEAESVAIEWLSPQDLTRLPLHPGFAASWPALRAALQPLVVVLDVLGQEGGGTAAQRLAAPPPDVRDALEALSSRGVPALALPDALRPPQLTAWRPDLVLVADTGAPCVSDLPCSDGAVAARADVVGLLRTRRESELLLVVTGDPELRSACSALGIHVEDVAWLHGLPASAGD